jgi:hypothetical protein
LTCSFAAGRTSVAETIAPRRRAVAIGLQPGDAGAHDEDMWPAGTVPAAVIIIGKPRVEGRRRPSITAR